MCARAKSKPTKQKTSVSLDRDVMVWLKGECERLDRSASWIINNMLREKSGKDERG